MEKRKIITLCGSKRFKEYILTVAADLSLKGNIVMIPSIFWTAGWNLSDQDYQMLDDVHRAKIDMSDLVYIVNLGGYIGSDTRKELEYAKSIGKEIQYYYERKIPKGME